MSSSSPLNDKAFVTSELTDTQITLFSPIETLLDIISSLSPLNSESQMAAMRLFTGIECLSYTS